MIDCDVHCAPGSWGVLEPYLSPSSRHYVEGGGTPLAGVTDAYPAGARTSATADARQASAVHTPTSYDELKTRLLDTSGATRTILNCLTIFDAHRNPYYQSVLASALNDWLCSEWLERDDRLYASLVVPWADPDAAVAEIERVGENPRFIQVLLPIRSESPWGKRANHRIYSAAFERGLAIGLHAWGLFGHAPTASGFTTTYLEDYLSNATIAQQHVLSFVAEGVFEKVPELRVVLVECGFTWVPSLLWRMDKHWKSFWPEIPWVKEKPSYYVRRNMRATIAPAHLGDATAQHMAELVEMIGADWLLYASDFPHDHGPSAQRLLNALDGPTREAVLGGNAAAFYNLGVVPSVAQATMEGAR